MSPCSSHREVGQLVFVGFTGTSVPVEVRAMARDYALGGVVLFARNVESPGQVAELAHDLQQLSGNRPLWIAVDQEGGRVARLKRPFTEWPPMGVLGRSGQVDLAARFARAMGAELSAVGISIDLAPVVDVHTNLSNPVIGDRALAADPEVVARLGAAIINGLQEAGLAACAKHFPGHGDTSLDSHLALPVLDHGPARLRDVELVPFRAAIASGVESILTAHLLVPSLDQTLPASLSPAIVTGLLRDQLGYGGLVLTDDLEMKAVRGERSSAEAAVASLVAGCDAALLCHPDPDAQVAAIEAIIRAVESGELAWGRLDCTAARHRAAQARVQSAAARARRRIGRAGPGPLDRAWRPPSEAELAAIVGAGDHRRIADEVLAWA